jgi:hypothetical protein
LGDLAWLAVGTADPDYVNMSAIGVRRTKDATAKPLEGARNVLSKKRQPLSGQMALTASEFKDLP